MEDIRQRAENFARLHNFTFTTERPNNGFLGYINGSTVLWLNGHRVILVVTCGNCGNGSHINITNII
jgi:hypothetical protein